MREEFFDVAADLLAISRPDGFFEWVSPAWTWALGWTAEELTSKPWLDFVHPDDRERSLTEAAALDRGVESVRFENRYQTKGGDYRWLSWKTKPAPGKERFYSAASDITERKKAEIALEEALALQKLIVETATDFAIQVVDPTGHIQQWNSGAERIFGFAREEACGQKTDIIFTPEDRALNMPAREMQSAVKDGCAADERWHQRKNGELVFISGVVRPLYASDGTLKGFVKIGRDITERKRMEDELKEARENLERLVANRTAKLEETVHQLEQFSYSIVHDLRAPLRSMFSFAQLLATEYAEKLDEGGKNYLKRIERLAGRMDALIRDVLTYGKVSQENVQLGRIDLEALLEQMTGENRSFQPPQSSVEWDKPLLPVQAHDALLSQCLWNLLSNAIKFVPKGVTPQVRVRTEPRGDAVRIWVEDNGIGIEPQYIQKIFGMFQRLHTESEYPGTGIGLAIVRKAAERMGGTMGVESEPGKGSRFWIQLKAASSV